MVHDLVDSFSRDEASRKWDEGRKTNDQGKFSSFVFRSSSREVEFMMAQLTVCPHCGQPQNDGSGSPAQASPGLAQELEKTRTQLITYAHDLAKAYAAQKHMAQYLPSGLRNRISQGDEGVAGERRYVTVLFADLVNFTRLAVHMDAEEVFSLMNACFQRLVAHVLRYEGVIDKFIGDGLMALFGAPVAHEDDPERAVRAALDMQAEMEIFSREMQSRLESPLQLHIGINSGEVIAGSIGVEEQLTYTVMGEAINLAFRLQQLAEPGSVFVGESVYRQTKHLFDYQYLGDYKVKGFEVSLPVFSVRDEQETPALTQPTGDVSLPWMGRDQELARLTELSRRLARGEGGVATVLGEAGLGKTRLVREWLAALPSDAVTVWWGTAQMFQQRISYSLCRNLLRQALYLRPGGVSPPEVAIRQALLAQLGDLTPFILALVHNQTPESETHLTPENARSQTFQAVRDLLVAGAKRGPLILVLDNWQWADDLSRELLLASLSLADEHPILFCILSRSGIGIVEDPTQEIEAQVAHSCQRIELEPLRLSDSWELLSSLIVAENLTDEARAAFFGRVQQAQGNPLSLKELLQILIAEKIIEPGSTSSTGKGPRWRVVRPEGLASLRIPPTLGGLAQANLDRLPLELQEILDYAAVIGPTFSLGLLQAVVAREREISALPARLQELVARGIIESIMDGSRTFAFRHTIVQETIYNGLLSHRRRALHRLVADELEILPESDTDASVEVMSYHFHQAGVPAKAVPYLIRAGRRAQNRAAHKVAIEHYLAALAVLDNASRYEGERLGLEMALGDAYCHLGQYDEAATHYGSALNLSTQPDKRANIYRLLGSTYAAKGDWKRARRGLERALECLAEGGVAVNSVIRGQVYADCAQVEWRLGDHQQAEFWAREAIVILEGTPVQDTLAVCYEMLSRTYADLGRESLADQYATQAAALRQNRAHCHTPRTAYLLDQR
jgi:adenylate cyclase